jgi:transposase InsO family protein
MVSPARRREAVKHLVRRFRVSERRACRVLGQHRSTQRYEPVPADYEQSLVKRMNELAAENPRWGYRTITTLLVGEGWKVNHKRVRRLWVQEGNRVPRRRSKASGRRAEGVRTNAAWKLRARHPNHIWGMDFMGETTRRGNRFRIFNIVDEFTRVALVCRVDKSIGTRAVMDELEPVFQANGRPKIIRCDNGREFIASSLKKWLAERGVAIAYIEKGRPQQNCFIERYHGSMRDEVLTSEDFDTVLEARIIVRQWAFDVYNTRRPHRGHGMLTPRQFADRWKVGRR